MTSVDLTDQQRGVLLAVLAAHAPPIDRVDIYGSRASGNARTGSDVDLVLAGAIDRSTILGISGALDESYLSIAADVTAYELLSGGAFRDQILATAVTLFDQEELLAAREISGRVA